MFVDELNSRLNVSKPLPLSRYAAQAYDAVWAMALSLNGAESKWKQWQQSNNSSTIQPQLDHFDYTRYDMALEFFHQFSRLNFLGVSVCVSQCHLMAILSIKLLCYLFSHTIRTGPVWLCGVNEHLCGFALLFSVSIELAEHEWAHPLKFDSNIDF